VPGAAKVALTVVAALTVTLQVVLAPVQPPPNQPVNTEPPVAAAVNATPVPAG